MIHVSFVASVSQLRCGNVRPGRGVKLKHKQRKVGNVELKKLKFLK